MVEDPFHVRVASQNLSLEVGCALDIRLDALSLDILF